MSAFPDPVGAPPAAAAARWRRRYEREHAARTEAEGIAERGVRELYARQEQLRLLQAVASAANQAVTFTEIVGATLRLVGQHLGWAVGHALLAEAGAEGPQLASSGLWHCSLPHLLDRFQRAGDAGAFAPGIGLPGRVLASGRPAWIHDAAEDANFPRAEQARAAGLVAAFALPVLVGSEVVAVLEFFDTKQVEPSSGFLDLMAQIGLQLGRVAERQRYQERLQHDACHDPLTGLPNRALFLDRLGGAVARRQRHGEARFAVLFIDLDHFKLVNDSLGHSAGDELITQAALRLAAGLRASDAPARPLHTLARMGGDEFTVLLEDLREFEDAARVAECLQQQLDKAFLIAGNEFFITASIGIAGGGPEDTAELVLRNADMAMYRAKAQGRAAYAMYDEHMHASARQRLALETDLRNALHNHEFVLHYQPIALLRAGADRTCWTGVEALVRWRRPDGTLVPPEQFIPVAEETGLIRPLGLWVLREACGTLQGWRRRFAWARHLTMSVNVSPRQFAQPDLVAQVAAALEETGAAPEAVQLEITESVTLGDTGHALETLRQLKALGVKLSLDDFGTGYSSLGNLHRYPFDALKIDRSFIQQLATGPEAAEGKAMVRTILDLARNLGLQVIAEGVEAPAHMARLRALGCGHAQGYLFSRPLPAEQLLALMAARAPAAV